MIPRDERPLWWILDADHRAVPTDMHEWATFFKDQNNRRVAFDKVEGFAVSTLFLGTDRPFGASGPPLLFETMVFGSDDSIQGSAWWSTWDEAIEGHARMVDDVRTRGSGKRQ